MKINVLWIDDEEEFVEDLKYNICALESTFFKSLDTDIDEIEITIISEAETAFNIINNKANKIDLMILDIELKYNKEGHKEYEKLFYQGKAIPAIVVSAFATTPKRIEEIHAKGISVIIDKWKTERLSEKIVTKICEVLGSSAERILQIRNAVEVLRIHHNSITIESESRTIQQWMELIIKGETSKERELIIKQAITDECIRNFRLEEDHGEGFMRPDN